MKFAWELCFSLCATGNLSRDTRWGRLSPCWLDNRTWLPKNVVAQIFSQVLCSLGTFPVIIPWWVVSGGRRVKLSAICILGAQLLKILQGNGLSFLIPGIPLPLASWHKPGCHYIPGGPGPAPDLSIPGGLMESAVTPLSVFLWCEQGLPRRVALLRQPPIATEVGC